MPISQNKARELCSKDEFGIVRDSYRDELRHLTLADARRKAKHARKLQQKWSDLAEKQARRSKGAGKANAAAAGGKETPERTALKARIFKEALSRYEKYESKLEQKARKGQEQPLPEAQGGKYGIGGSIRSLFARTQEDKAKRMQQESSASRFARTIQQFGRTHSKNVSGHISTLDQMKQAKRDSRR